MRAQVGDWLVANSHTTGRPVRRGAILAVRPGGAPPFTVRWTDTDREAIVFPGADAEVISAARQAELGRAETARITQTQAAIIAGSHES